MDSKHSFWSLISNSPIEIPIIQRDYAQGRESEAKIRQIFLDTIYKHLISDKTLNLDFVYGSYENGKFIPLDGQQRLTTLFLLHWYLSVKEKRINETRSKLQKFTYETRTSSREFCYALINSNFDYNNILPSDGDRKNGLSKGIKNCSWFYLSWQKDPTIQSMLVMLDAIHEKFEDAKDLLPRLIERDPIICFQFIELKEFGLTDNLYIKMNARGKALTEFENFKARFEQYLTKNDQKINSRYRARFAADIDGKWTDFFWKYRNANNEIDNRFMRYFYFISEMLYYRGLEAEKTVSPFEFDQNKNPRLNFDLINNVYQKDENIVFLFQSLDTLSAVPNLDDLFKIIFAQNVYEEDKVNFFDDNPNLFERCFKWEKFDFKEKILFFSLIKYWIEIGYEPDDNLKDFVRVIRNLVLGSDLEYRYLHNQLKSIDLLIVRDVYVVLKSSLSLTGFNLQQREEEEFKAIQILQSVQNKMVIFRAEDLFYMKGNITALLVASFANIKSDISFDKPLKNFPAESFNFKRLNAIIEAYIVLTKNDCDYIFGDLLVTEVYESNYWRVWYNNNYLKNVGLIKLVFEKSIDANENLDLESFAIKIEKEYINEINRKFSDMSTIKSVKDQLYIYYIFSRRVKNKFYYDFFRNGFNFGWLPKAKGFTSKFTMGLENSDFDKEQSNPIFQTYKSQFRYSYGLNPDNAIFTEVVANGTPKDIFTPLITWANS